MWCCADISGFSRSTRLPRRGVFAAALLIVTAACQDSATEPEQAQVSAPALAVASNSWLTRANMPSDRINTTTATVTDAQGRTFLYVIGGRNPSSTAGFCSGGLSKVQAYDASTNTWSTKAPFPYPIQGTNGAGVIGGKIYMTGGCISNLVYRGWTWMYNPAINQWTQKAWMPVHTWAGNTGVIQGKLYVLSSCSGQSECGPQTDLYFGSYDPGTDTWTSLPLPPSKTAHNSGGSAVIGGKFYVVGGDNTGVVEVYDPATHQWATRAAMPKPRSGVASAAVGGKMYVIAGVIFSDFDRQSVSTTSMYDPVTNTWKNLAPAPRSGGGLAAGRVVVNGQARIELVGGARPGNNLQYIP
jgi:N-acetylneuraminic acid mutarotase